MIVYSTQVTTRCFDEMILDMKMCYGWQMRFAFKSFAHIVQVLMAATIQRAVLLLFFGLAQALHVFGATKQSAGGQITLQRCNSRSPVMIWSRTEKVTMCISNRIYDPPYA